jgi:hypothetical protein
MRSIRENRCSLYHLHRGNEELDHRDCRPSVLRTPAGCVEGAVRRHRRVPDWTARKPPDPELHDGAGARAGDQHHCLPGVVELPDSDKVLVQSATPGVADRVATAFPRASAIDRLERVAVGHLAPNEVLERPRSSTSGGVLDGLGRWR